MNQSYHLVTSQGGEYTGDIKCLALFSCRDKQQLCYKEDNQDSKCIFFLSTICETTKIYVKLA